jgi:hypothetical protein
MCYNFHFTGFRFEKTCQRSFQVSVIKTICFNPKIDVDPIDLKNALKITVFEPTKMAHIQKVLKWNIKKFRKLESLTFSCEVCLLFSSISYGVCRFNPKAVTFKIWQLEIKQ